MASDLPLQMRSDTVVAATAQAAAFQPAVSWTAVFAGAAVSLAVSIVLTGLAAGFGMRVAFPGVASRASLAAFTPALGAWAMAIQVLSSALGGYLAGRLRIHWHSSVHEHEVHFRDTAHGLIAWAVSTVVGVVLAATILAPYAERLATVSMAMSDVLPTSADAVLRAQRDADIAAQSSFFMAIGLMLSAFTAAVAAALGGLRTEEMRLKASALPI